MSRTYSAEGFIWLVLNKKKKPYIIVEGKDDIQFYENIVESIGKDYIVKPVGRYKDTSNCEAVIEWMQELDDVLDKHEHRQYFLGIIDGDARKYKKNLPKKNDLLYILEYYSWESYFINKEVVSKSIKNFLKTRTLLTDKSIDYIYTQYIEKYLLKELWLCGLQKLKDGENDKVCNQDNPINRLDNDKKFKKIVQGLEGELLLFASKNKLSKNTKTLLEITKGKWALSCFVKKYLQVLKKLPALCKDEKIQEIMSCDYCENRHLAKLKKLKWSSNTIKLTLKDYQYQYNEFCKKSNKASNDCLYELKANYKEEHIMADITNLVDITSLTPIKARLQQLK